MTQDANTMQLSGKEDIAFFLGNNIDKNELDNLNSYISKDHHIKRLVRCGSLKCWIVVISFLFLVTGIVLNILSSDKSISEIMKQKYIIIAIIIFIYYTISFVNDFIEAGGKIFTAIQFIPYLIKPNRRRNPLNIWSFYQGSNIDAQIVNTATYYLQDKYNCKVYYTGQPYFDYFFLDSIECQWNHTKIRNFFFRIRFFMDFSVKNMMAYADKAPFKDGEKLIECSNSVFGILFSSMYLKKCLSNGYYKGKLKIHITAQEQRKKDFIIEWMDCCIGSNNWYEVSSEEKPDLIVSDMIYYSTNEIKAEKLLSRIRSSLKRLHERKFIIPIKRLIVKETDNFVNSRKGIKKWIVLGGAEQHLGLQSMMNNYRRNKEYEIGYAENLFDVESKQCKLCVGTEGIVYTVGKHVLARITNKQNVTKKAKVFKMIIKEDEEMEVICVYGLSAMMTKIALITLLAAIKTNNNQYIPGEQYIVTDNIREYDLSDSEMEITINSDTINTETKVHETKLGKEFDQKDLMNNIDSLIQAIETVLKGE